MQYASYAATMSARENRALRRPAALQLSHSALAPSRWGSACIGPLAPHGDQLKSMNVSMPGPIYRHTPQMEAVLMCQLFTEGLSEAHGISAYEPLSAFECNLSG